MADNQLDTPVLLIAFNRPETTAKVFNEIRKAKPKILYVSVDGPRKEEDKKSIEDVKKIVSNVDWDCRLKTIFREKNLGCKEAFCGAMEIFFKDVKWGIILEDDIVPTPDFFYFCDYILKKYENNEKIMHISGTNVQVETKIKEDYFFSDRCFNFWGWATWRRAWEKYDKNMLLWPKVRIKMFFKMLIKEGLFSSIKSTFLLQKVYDGKLDVGDYQWDFMCKLNKGLSVIPRNNLVTNIGFSKNATHTSEVNLSLPSKGLKIKEDEIIKIKINKKYGRDYFRFFAGGSYERLIKLLKRLLAVKPKKRD